MGRFWDCSILGELNNLGTTIELIEECVILGYHGVVLNYVIDIKDRHVKGALHAFIDDDYEKIVTYFGQKIKIRKRLTLNLIKSKTNDINYIIKNEHNRKLMDKFDLLAVCIDNFFTNQPFVESIIKCKAVDIINLDQIALNRTTGKVQSTYFKQLIRGCSSKKNGTNKYFEVSLKAFRTNVKNTLFSVNFIGSVIGYRNFIFSTSASEKLQCKYPKDLLNVTNLFDSKIKCSKIQNCISKNVEDALENSRIHRIAFEESIESAIDSTQSPNKKILAQIEAELTSKNIKKDTHQLMMRENVKSKVFTVSSIGKKKWKNKKVKMKKSNVKSFKR